MEQWKRWHEELTLSHDDVRLEVVASELLMDEHISEQEIFFFPNGGFHRMVDKDIAGIQTPGATARKTDRAFFILNRRGIYDGVPECTFHQSRQPKPFKSISEIKSEIVYQNKVEEDARKFFSPFDNELIYTRCQIEINERQKTSNILNNSRKEGLKNFWEIPNMFSIQEQGRLMLLLPLCYRIASSLLSAAQALETVLEIPVTITEETARNRSTEHVSFVRLGVGQLGVDFLTSGADNFTENELKIEIGPLGIVEASSYADGQIGADKMSYLADYFIPADRQYRLEILIQEEEQYMELNDVGSFTRLGVSTILN